LGSRPEVHLKLRWTCREKMVGGDVKSMFQEFSLNCRGRRKEWQWKGERKGEPAYKIYVRTRAGERGERQQEESKRRSRPV